MDYNPYADEYDLGIRWGAPLTRGEEELVSHILSGYDAASTATAASAAAAEFEAADVPVSVPAPTQRRRNEPPPPTLAMPRRRNEPPPPTLAMPKRRPPGANGPNGPKPPTQPIVTQPGHIVQPVDMRPLAVQRIQGSVTEPRRRQLSPEEEEEYQELVNPPEELEELQQAEAVAKQRRIEFLKQRTRYRSYRAWKDNKLNPGEPYITFDNSEALREAHERYTFAKKEVRRAKLAYKAYKNLGSVKDGQPIVNRSRLTKAKKKVCPYECDTCGERFTERTNMNRHIRNKHGASRKHECPYCAYKTPRTLDLKKHIKHMHPEKVKTTGSRAAKKYVCRQVLKDYDPNVAEDFSDDDDDDPERAEPDICYYETYDLSDMYKHYRTHKHLDNPKQAPKVAELEESRKRSGCGKKFTPKQQYYGNPDYEDSDDSDV